MPKYAKIIVDRHHQRIDHVYTYLTGSFENQICTGMLVSVPFGTHSTPVRGYVLDVFDEPENDLSPSILSHMKSIRSVLADEPVLNDFQIDIARQMAHRYMAPLSSCLSLFVSRQAGIRQSGIRQNTDRNLAPHVVCLCGDASEKEGQASLGKAQQRFLSALEQEGGTAVLSRIRKTAPLSRQSLESLVRQQYIVLKDESEGIPPADFVSGENRRLSPGEETVFVRPELNEDQLQAVTAVENAMESGTFQEFLLFGITGSGKTEVYMNCIEKTVKQGRQAIMLVPEISLTPQLIDVFTRRFGSRVGITHSRMSDAQRARVWEEAKDGNFDIIIGPRSALFTPFSHLGLIILDEEHETSYCSEQMAPHYHARQVGEMMARKLGIVLLLGSATPSLETFYRAQQGEIRLLRLSRRAAANSSLPAVKLEDMRLERSVGNVGTFSADLVEGISRRLRRKEQTILFLNRKGYATFVNCRSCGFVLKCPKCFLPYTYHKDVDKLICHHCGKTVDMPAVCPQCGSVHIRQFGIGTQRVEEEVRNLFPKASVVRMDMETMKKREDYEKVYQTFRDGKGDILIGTQMVSKGFDFPRVTLVGVICADMTLYNGDYHSTERTFQLLTQVSGRAGRAGLPGEVLIQTFSPEHYCMQMARDQNYEGFYRQEILSRKLLQTPPYTHIAQIVLSGTGEQAVRESAVQMGTLLRRYAKGRPFEVLGPSPAQLFRVNAVFKWKLLVKCKDLERLTAYTQYCVEKFISDRKSLRSQVNADIDPMNIL